MDRTRGQRLRLTMGLQRPRHGIDAEGVGAVRCAGNARSAVAGNDVEVSLRGVGPSILDVGGQDDRAALFERSFGDVDAEQGQLRAGVGVENRVYRHVLTPAEFAALRRAIRPNELDRWRL